MPDSLAICRVYAALPEDDPLRARLRHAVKAGEDGAVGLLLRQAQRQLEPEPDDGEPVQLPEARQARERVADAEESTEAQWVVEDAEGLSPVEVASETGLSASRVEAIRRNAGLRARDGGWRSPWYGWSDERRRRVIAEAVADGYSVSKMAEEIGVSRATVSRYMPAQ